MCDQQNKAGSKVLMSFGAYATSEFVCSFPFCVQFGGGLSIASQLGL